MTPYYSDDLVELYHGDARDILPGVIERADVIVMDPPYGIGWSSGHAGVLPRSIEGDGDSMLRDWALEEWAGKSGKVDYTRPALVFGTWKVERPAATRQVLVWDSQGALGMGDLSLPWKPAHQEIYVIGKGFRGYRGTDVLSYHPEQSTARRGRLHPHQKPLPLLRDLIQKCPPEWVILDPFAGVASTLVAAKSLNRKAIGIETDAEYCRKGAYRLAQDVLRLPNPSDLRGLVPGLTGGLGAEKWVRMIRDGEEGYSEAEIAKALNDIGEIRLAEFVGETDHETLAGILTAVIRRDRAAAA